MEIANKLFKDKMHDIHKRYTKRKIYIHYRQLPHRKCQKIQVPWNNYKCKQHEEIIGAYLKENENIWNISRLKLKSAINQYFNQLWVEQTPLYIKAGIYKLFKNKVGMEDYPLDITSRRHRVTYAKFRLSDHDLMIEEGRRKRPEVPRGERICLLCAEEVEDEIHFLMKCTSKNTKKKNTIYRNIKNRTIV